MSALFRSKNYGATFGLLSSSSEQASISFQEAGLTAEPKLKPTLRRFTLVCR
jgi:hypothetical protein